MYESIKNKLLSTYIPKWLRIACLSVLVPLIVGPVILFGFLAAEIHERPSINSEFNLSIIWCISELILVFYIFLSNSVCRLAAFATMFSVLFSNVWFLVYALQLHHYHIVYT